VLTCVAQGDLAKVQLSRPVCTEQGEKIALSRRVEKHWRLIGWGKIVAGKTVQQQQQQAGKGDKAEAKPAVATATPGPGTVPEKKNP
jgi:hypothetical protein